jgi:hypothetical protein
VGVILAITVHGRDNWVRRCEDARAHRGALAASLSMAQITQPRAFTARHQPLDLSGGSVVARVIDDDNLAQALGRDRTVGLLNQLSNVASFIQRRNDDGDAHKYP